MARAARVVGARGGGGREEAAGCTALPALAFALGLAALMDQLPQLPFPLHFKEGPLRCVALLPCRQAAQGHLQVVTSGRAWLADQTLAGGGAVGGEREREKEREREEGTICLC